MGVQAGAIDCGSGSTSISGLDGRPSCILFLGTNQTTYESAIQPTQGGGFFGFAVEDSGGTIHNYCEFAILTTGRCSNLSQNCARAQATAGAFDPGNRLYEAQVTAIANDGFTVTFSQTASGYQIHYLAIWDIQPGYVFPYEPLCDGITFDVDVGFSPAVFFMLGQWRGTCHVFPKSTSSSLWNALAFGDVSASTTTYCVGSQSTIQGLWTSGVDELPGATASLGGYADPFVLGSICTGTNSIGLASPTEIEITNVGCGDRYDLVFAQMSTCLLGDCVQSTLGAGAIDSETPITFDRVHAPEAVIFNNFQLANDVSLNLPKRWGVGFATPDYECGFSIDESDGSFFQSEENSWISQTTALTASYGQVNFAPSSGDIGLAVKGNAAGNGTIGFMGIITGCLEWMPQIYRYVYPPPAV